MRSHKLTYGAVSLLLCCLPAFAKEYRASHYDVTLAVAEGGALNVTENVGFEFENGPFTFVYRTLATKETDGIDQIEALMDGAPCSQGTQPGQVEIKSGSPVSVRWHFAPAEHVRHTFELRYRVLGVIRKLDGRDALIWRSLPPDREYRIGTSRITLEYPAAVSLAQAPSIQKVDEPFTVSPGRAVIELHDPKPGFPAIVNAAFPAGSLNAPAPAWQMAEAKRGDDFRGGLRQGALASVVFAIAAFLALFAARRNQPQKHEVREVPHPPSDLNPSLAARLTGSHGGAAALLLELASRGVLRIEQMAPGRWGKPDYRVDLVADSATLAPHERTLIGVMFPGGARTTTMSECGSRVGAAWSQIAAALERELREAGLIDEERTATRRKLMALSVTGLLLAFPLFVAGMVLYKRDAAQLAGMLIVFSLSALVVCFIALIAAGMLSRLTDRGEALKAQWKGFAAYLREAGRGDRNISWNSEFERVLPYAAAFGLAGAWTKAYQAAGGVAPSWFSAAEGCNVDVAIMSFIATSNSDGGASAGAASAGASGGGSSGAG